MSTQLHSRKQAVSTRVPRGPFDTPVDSPLDRFMRALLRVELVESKDDTGAQRAFQTSLVISGVRCIITYLLVPIVIPVVSVAGLFVAPLSIALCVFAAVSGTISLRRFWRSNHRGRWMYTGFMFFVYLVLAFAIVTDVLKLIG
ncbi:hypothetical protein [Gulosibacter chungangensis]|uniref:Uncharacterized protein n=1 Tax=Gulosibacter chungangensis TaxID=979746 RepID=A0A7J5BAM7_9MICO|nr:hypothetical protein [Gulosibacter chungangensis]KAB1643142.1 hypothetical protein F8O05_07835 [Gulosibacter chungangensis]